MTAKMRRVFFTDLCLFSHFVKSTKSMLILQRGSATRASPKIDRFKAKAEELGLDWVDVYESVSGWE